MDNQNNPVVQIDPANLSLKAQRAVRLKFNPSQIDRVARIKLLAAQLVEEMHAVQKDAIEKGRDVTLTEDPRISEAYYDACEAINHVVTASMHCVRAATATIS